MRDLTGNMTTIVVRDGSQGWRWTSIIGRADASGTAKTRADAYRAAIEFCEREHALYGETEGETEK